MAKHALPHEFQPKPKKAHRAKISRYSMVLIEALQNPPQPCSGLVQRFVHPAAQRLLNLLQLRHHPLFRRLTPDHKQAPWTAPTLVNESEERERLWFLLSPLAPVHSRIPAELQQTRLLRMKFQIELRQPLPKLVLETLGISLILEPHPQVVRVADNNNLPARHLLTPCFPPKVEDVMQVHVRN